jgi:hypothetical protein
MMLNKELNDKIKLYSCNIGLTDEADFDVLNACGDFNIITSPRLLITLTLSKVIPIDVFKRF